MISLECSDVQQQEITNWPDSPASPAYSVWSNFPFGDHIAELLSYRDTKSDPIAQIPQWSNVKKKAKKSGSNMCQIRLRAFEAYSKQMASRIGGK
jgi:hypothetical protein